MEIFFEIHLDFAKKVDINFSENVLSELNFPLIMAFSPGNQKKKLFAKVCNLINFKVKFALH